VERVRLEDSGIALEGAFELPPLGRLTEEEQVFVAAFVRSHGSIREMERLFGISYPTVKNRLNALSEKLDFVTVGPAPVDRAEILDRLERGEISAREALKLLEES
jgi:hypothetical protein